MAGPAAERGLRHLVTRHPLAGGSRSEAGTDTTLVLAPRVGPWRARGLDPWPACRHRLASPQPQL
jgi:hypothetical protein